MLEILILISIILIGTSIGLFGSFMLWNGLAYTGDVLSHIAILSVALSALFGISPIIAIIFTGILMAWLLVTRDKSIGLDGFFNVITSVSMAYGLAIFYFLKIDYDTINITIFGDDHVTLSIKELWLCVIGGISFILYFRFRWKDLIKVSIDNDLSFVEEKINYKYLTAEFIVMLSIFIALISHISGMLFITSILVMSPITMRSWSKTPLQMVVGSSLLSIFIFSIVTLIEYFHHFNYGIVLVIVSSIILIISATLNHFLQNQYFK